MHRLEARSIGHRSDVAAGDAPRVLLGGLHIGLVLDLTNRQVFFTDLGGSLSDLSPTQTK
jgi:hypothetical protein